MRNALLGLTMILSVACSSVTQAFEQQSAATIESTMLADSPPPTNDATPRLAPEGEEAPPTYEVTSVLPGSAAAATWRADCPIALEALSLIRVPFVDFEGTTRTGEIVVHALTADRVGQLFVDLAHLDFRITSIDLIGEHDGDDNASMSANNTSGFNCRFVAGTTRWSNHAQGLAIDINPLLNPWVTSRGVFPPDGVEYQERPLNQAGVINPGDTIINLFAEIGWSWGGDWAQPDYQHFEFEID